MTSSTKRPSGLRFFGIWRRCVASSIPIHSLLEDPQIELKRYSATLGIQGRIDAVSRQGNRLDILELKTGSPHPLRRPRTALHLQASALGPCPALAAR